MLHESTAVPPSHDGARRKLGLALAGGGFRASLFHLGVLHRLAQLDLLRRVEVLSTVSGGSVIGALYMLLLKRDALRHPAGRLERQDYIALVKELDRRLTSGITLNLRNALFWNPLALLRVILTRYTIGERMGDIYERYLYREVVEQLRNEGYIEDQRPAWQRWLWPGRIRLADIRAQPSGRPLAGGVEEFNRAQAGDPSGAAVTKLVLNATCVNSGARFWFSSAELGDWTLGYFRHSEVKRLETYRTLLRTLPAAGAGESSAYARIAEGPDPVVLGGRSYARRTVLLARWLRDHPERERARFQVGDWRELFDEAHYPDALVRVKLGLLRQAKLSAWYLRVGADRTAYDPPVTGGFSAAQHLDQLWAVLDRVDPALADGLQAFAGASDRNRDLLLDFLLELYWLRSADVAAPSLARDLDRLTLGQAVAASACFPPVFPPITWFGFYDDAHVARLGLTDGGVFDNMGIIALMDEGCNYIIASDTSGVFRRQVSATTGRLGLSIRLGAVLSEDLAAMQRDILRERRRVSDRLDRVAAAHARALDELPAGGAGRVALEEVGRQVEAFHSTRQLRGLAYFEIASPCISGPTGAKPPCDLATLAETRTDLDGFGEAEIAALALAGYAAADGYVRKYLADFKPADSDDLWSAPLDPPRPMPEADDLKRIVRVSRRRFFRSLYLRGWWAVIPWLWTLAATAAALWLLWRVPASLPDLFARLPDAVAGLTVWDGWLRIPSGRLALGLLVAAGLVMAAQAARGLSRTYRRWLGWLGKWAMGSAGMVLLFFGWKPLVAIVVAVSLYSWINWLVYHQPFLRLTTLERGGRAPAASSGS